MKKIGKTTCILMALLISLSVSAGTVCTCESGSMTVEITDDGKIKMSCSDGGRIRCTMG